MTLTLSHWLHALEFVAFDGTSGVTNSLLGSSCAVIRSAARRSLEDAFLTHGANDAHVEAVLDRCISELRPAHRRQVGELAEDFSHAWAIHTPIGWIIVLREVAAAEPRGDGTPGGLEAGAAAWRDANVDGALASIRDRGPSAWDRRYLAAKGYPSAGKALDAMLALAHSLLRLRAFEASWAAMLSSAGDPGMGARDLVTLARAIAQGIGLPAHQIGVPRLPPHRHLTPPEADH